MIENDWDSEERRKQERLSLSFILRVYRYKGNDANSSSEGNVLLGHIVDISTGGLMLLSEKPMASNQHLNLLLEIELADEVVEKIVVSARSVWSRKDPNPGWFNTGFKFVEVSAEAGTAIGRLINALKAL